MESNLVNEDCLKFISTLEDRSIDLAILDPPYNVQAANWDRVENYLDWMKEVVNQSCRTLKDNGSLYVWGTSRNNDFLKLKLWMDDNIKLEFKNWIVWVHKVKIHRKLKDRFLCKHEDLLFYAHNNIFNTVRDEPPEFQLKMHAGRYDDNFFIEKDKLPPSQQRIFKKGLQLGSPAKSWWLGPSNQSNGKVYKKFAGYKSEWVCDRIIRTSSNENDIVLIPFAGTGTECVVAKNLNRHFVACEIDKERYQVAIGRLGSA
jgi:DNA modification methylase